MAKGILNIQAADGAVIGLHVPDGLTSGERPISLGVNLSGITAYHLLQGNLAVSASTITQGFNTTLYTGNGSTQSINTGIDMSTQWGNDASETFGGLVWLKDRVTPGAGHVLADTIRGVNKYVQTNTTNAETSLVGYVTAFNNNGFSIGNQYNINGDTHASWNFQTTHRVTGTTNHGKAYTCHYNPYTGFTIIKYEGSGLVGHEIPHHLGRKLDFIVNKELSTINLWLVTTSYSSDLRLNTMEAQDGAKRFDSNESNIINTISTSSSNTNGVQCIVYGWANSYFDEDNTLIGNYEIGVYQGTGVAGNKVTTRGKPSMLIRKRIDSTGNWLINDNVRNTLTQDLYINLNIIESDGNNDVVFNTDNFTINANGSDSNTSGGQYLYLVAYDTNSNGGGSYYPLASDTANLQVNNALIPIAQGIDSNGAKNTILSKNETITGLTYTQGKNYVYYDVLGNKGVSAHKPRYLDSELIRSYAGESPDYFNVKENKWYSTNSGSELVTNGTFTSNTTGWTAVSGCIITFSNGMMSINRNSQPSNVVVYQDISGLTVGKKYRLSAVISNGTQTQGSMDMRISNTDFTSEIVSYLPYSTSQKTTIDFTAVNTTMRVSFGQSSTNAGAVIYIDNVSLFETTITPTTEITNGRNYLNHIVYADNDGGVLYVEELPKIEYKDTVKANEFKGKNACTAWVNFDGTTTPPTIRDSYNVSSVVRVSTGQFEVYFGEPMDNTKYTIIDSSSSGGTSLIGATEVYNNSKLLNKFHFITFNTTDAVASANNINILIFGGKN